MKKKKRLGESTRRYPLRKKNGDRSCSRSRSPLSKSPTHTPRTPQSATKTTVSVNTFNKYADLTDNESEINSNTTTPVINRKVKIPPIVAINMEQNEIKKIMDDLKIINFNLKYISLGIKILCDSLDEYSKVISTLKIMKKEFYSHDIPSQQTSKFVLYGLPELSIDEVKDGLHVQNLHFADVKKMRTKNDSKDYALFLVYFPYKSIKLQDLKTKKHVLNVIVNWKPYTTSRSGPTQCNNCQLHGHGAKNCGLPPRCSICGGKHESSTCLRDHFPLPEQVYKCCLCADNHSSRDRNCPKRIEFIKMKLGHRSSNSNNNSTSQKSNNTKPAPLIATEFPSLPMNKNMGKPNVPDKSTDLQSEYNPLPTNKNIKYSGWFEKPALQPCQPSSANQAFNDSLLSPLELIQLTKDLITNLRSCRNRMDQFEVVTRLAIKYINYD